MLKSKMYKRKNLEETEIQAVAIAEILNPTFALTRQFLAVNKVVFKENRPFVEDVIIQEQENIAEVYFPIEGERYYFVVYIHIEPQLTVNWMGMSAGNCVYFFATSEEYSLDELIATVGMGPTRTWIAGSKRPGIPRHNGFEIKPYAKETGEVEDKLRNLINVLLPYKANLHALSVIASIGINIAYWGYKEQMWGVHLDAETIQGLAILNLSLDVDIYASGPDLAD